jgi:hypothetical protein
LIAQPEADMQGRYCSLFGLAPIVGLLAGALVSQPPLVDIEVDTDPLDTVEGVE